jgi:hypothetical protein
MGMDQGRPQQVQARVGMSEHTVGHVKTAGLGLDWVLQCIDARKEIAWWEEGEQGRRGDVARLSKGHLR